MPLNITKGYQQLVAEAEKEVETVTVEDALATQLSQQMGLSPVAHIEGGFDAWTKAGGLVARKERK
jgi:hypothetical protein